MKDNSYTVVIPAYNASKYIAEAIQSVLSQTVPPHAIIVVNDGSSDTTAQVALAQGPLVKVITTQNNGPGAATTIGIAAVTTPIVATLDADDLWYPHKMKTQLHYLLDIDNRADGVMARLEPFGETEKKIALVENSGWSRTSLVLWMDSYRKVGNVEEIGKAFGDVIDWFARAKELGLNLKILNEPLAGRRIHSESLSFKGGQDQAHGFLQSAIRALERKRQLK